MPCVRRSSRGLLALAIAVLLASCGSDTTNQADAPLLASGFYESAGLQIHYESFGAGDPILLVHGYGVDLHLNWDSTGWIDALRGDRLVIALDIRGHGDSDKPHQAELYGYATMAQDVLNFLDHFGIERADYMGYSMGAFMGAYLLGHHPERLRSAVLGGIGDETAGSIAQAPLIAAAMRAKDLDEIEDPDALGWRLLIDADPRNDREALALAALTMWPQGFPRHLGGAGLADVEIPVLVVNGSLDVPYVETDQDLVAAIPGATLTEIPGRDHFSAVWDEGFKTAALSFLAARP